MRRHSAPGAAPNQPTVLSQALTRQGLLLCGRESESVLRPMEIDQLLEDLKKYEVDINR